MYEKKFSVYGVENPLKLCIFTHVPVSLLKTPGRTLKNVFSPRRKGWMEETMIFFIKIQSEKMRITFYNLYFAFCMIYNFSKCNGFTVL